MSKRYEKLSAYADRMGVGYRAAWNWHKAGKIDSINQNGTILVAINEGDSLSENRSNNAAIYARVSSSENKDNLNSQADRLYDYSTARGYSVSKVVKEVGSGVNDNRKKLLTLLKDDSWGVLVIEHKDRLTRFGYKYLELLASEQGRRIEVLNTAEDPKKDGKDYRGIES